MSACVSGELQALALHPAADAAMALIKRWHDGSRPGCSHSAAAQDRRPVHRSPSWRCTLAAVVASKYAGEYRWKGSQEWTEAAISSVNHCRMLKALVTRIRQLLLVCACTHCAAPPRFLVADSALAAPATRGTAKACCGARPPPSAACRSERVVKHGLRQQCKQSSTTRSNIMQVLYTPYHCRVDR
jgi:hypothetical protein